MSARRLRADLPFRRPAVVLSGGGALGAYEVGVLRVLEAVRLAPAIVAGVSIGALNAVMLAGARRRTAALEEVWRRLTATRRGLPLGHAAAAHAGRAGGGAGRVRAGCSTLAGSRELSGSLLALAPAPARASTWRRRCSTCGCGACSRSPACWRRCSRGASRPGWRAAVRPADPGRAPGAGLRPRAARAVARRTRVVWALGAPWPHRFSVSVLLVDGAGLARRAGRASRTAGRGVLLHALHAGDARARTVGRDRARSACCSGWSTPATRGGWWTRGCGW